MIAGFILIVILGGYTSQSGYAVVVAEFFTREACEAARAHIVASAVPKSQGGNSGDAVAQLRSHGCYSKGERK